MPGAKAVIRPLGLIAATLVLLLLHIPPDAPLVVYVVLVFKQIVALPDIVPGFAFGPTVTDFDATGD